jgi:2-polyprenyl-3-methyl-5-hydroxy-6-metoxy-1,4-benzoquinol methylase
MVDRLSEKDYWDTVLRNAKLPRINSEKNYNYYVTMNFIDPILQNYVSKKFMEIGAGASSWLPYFAKKYNLEISGLDYSEIGCEIARENLKILGIDYKEIICQDIFNWNSSEKYDIIFSYGVIEHFEDPGEILKICSKHLNKDGVIISLVPNLNGLNGILSKIFVNKIFKMHKVISKEELIKYHEDVGLVNIKTNYVGIFSLGVIPWIKSELWILKEGTIQGKIFLKIIWIFNGLLSKIFFMLKKDYPSKLLSPYIISIAKKNSL